MEIGMAAGENCFLVELRNGKRFAGEALATLTANRGYADFGPESVSNRNEIGPESEHTPAGAGELMVEGTENSAVAAEDGVVERFE